MELVSIMCENLQTFSGTIKVCNIYHRDIGYLTSYSNNSQVLDGGSVMLCYHVQ